MELKCFIEDTCKQRGSDLCCSDCWKMLQLDFQYKLSGMPMDYVSRLSITPDVIDREAFIKLRDYKDSIYRHVKTDHMGLFLFSDGKGNGKTTWAIKILCEYFKQLHRTIETFEHAKGIFVNVPILFDKLRNNIENPSKEVMHLEKHITEADLVIFDDIGTEAPTKWVREKLYVFITHRELAGKPSIFTSNLSLDQLEDEELLGERIVDRIHGQVKGNIIKLKGRSRRRGK